MAARFKLTISRSCSRNWRNITSALRECESREEKLRRMWSGWVTLASVTAAVAWVGVASKGLAMGAGPAAPEGAAPRRSSSALSARVRTGLDNTCVTPRK